MFNNVSDLLILHLKLKKSIILVIWYLPLPSCIKVYIDGDTFGSLGFSSCVGILEIVEVLWKFNSFVLLILVLLLRLT